MACLCPCFEGELGRIKDLNAVNFKEGNWQEVSVHKLNANGTTALGTFDYTMNVQTGELYLDESRAAVALKSFGVFLGALPYGACIMLSHMVKLAIDIIGVAWRTLAQFAANWKHQGAFSAIYSVFFGLLWEIPEAAIVACWRVARSPLYAIGMMFGAACAMVSPYKGRELIGKVEQAWHDGLSFKEDIRIGKKSNFLENLADCSMLFQEIKAGKIFFLAWCMQPRGNIHAKVGNIAKYRLASP